MAVPAAAFLLSAVLGGVAASRIHPQAVLSKNAAPLSSSVLQRKINVGASDQDNSADEQLSRHARSDLNLTDKQQNTSSLQVHVVGGKKNASTHANQWPWGKEEEETKEEAKQETKEETTEQAKEETKETTKEEAKEETKEEAKDEPVEEAKQETKEETTEQAKEETKETTKEEAKEETKEEAKDEPVEEAKEEVVEEPVAKVGKLLLEGLWTKKGAEKKEVRVISGETITGTNLDGIAVTRSMQIKNVSCINLNWGVLDYVGCLEDDGDLHWSDGDVWIRYEAAVKCAAWPSAVGSCSGDSPAELSDPHALKLSTKANCAFLCEAQKGDEERCCQWEESRGCFVFRGSSGVSESGTDGVATMCAPEGWFR